MGWEVAKKIWLKNYTNPSLNPKQIYGQSHHGKGKARRKRMAATSGLGIAVGLA
jgi:hypothetical protein